ncbi:hypothetical protein [Streptomyces anatolicus]|uniref:hypothetical protein n=1 Tax=Streptomyces anatolicus TaxID=2675858 RepID=UPI0027E13C74|nr:hypothetical protein [Streptomyces anatolicus]
MGDEVEYAPDCRAIVTDVRQDVLILRVPGGLEWPAADPNGLRITRLRKDRQGVDDYR